MGKCRQCSNNLVMGNWNDYLPDILHKEDNTVMLSFHRFALPVKGYICVPYNWFCIGSQYFEQLTKKANYQTDKKICFNCGRKLKIGYWSGFLPLFKKAGENSVLILNLIGKGNKIEVQFCPDCLIFINTHSEYEEIANVNSDEDVKRYYASKMEHNILFRRYVTKGASILGLMSLIASLMVFLLKPSEYEPLEKATILAIIGVINMSIGMIVGSLIGIICFKLKYNMGDRKQNIKSS